MMKACIYIRENITAMEFLKKQQEISDFVEPFGIDDLSAGLMNEEYSVIITTTENAFATDKQEQDVFVAHVHDMNGIVFVVPGDGEIYVLSRLKQTMKDNPSTDDKEKCSEKEGQNEPTPKS